MNVQHHQRWMPPTVPEELRRRAQATVLYHLQQGMYCALSRSSPGHATIHLKRAAYAAGQFFAAGLYDATPELNREAANCCDLTDPKQDHNVAQRILQAEFDRGLKSPALPPEKAPGELEWPAYVDKIGDVKLREQFFEALGDEDSWGLVLKTPPRRPWHASRFCDRSDREPPRPLVEMRMPPKQTKFRTENERLRYEQKLQRAKEELARREQIAREQQERERWSRRPKPLSSLRSR